MRAVLVSVSDLDRSIGFYQDVANLRERFREDQLAVLGDEALPPLYLYLRVEGRGPIRSGQGALGVRGLSMDVPSGAELDRIEERLRSLNLLRDRHRFDDEEGLEVVRGYDPDRLALVFVWNRPQEGLSVARFQRIAGLIYGWDL